MFENRVLGCYGPRRHDRGLTGGYYGEGIHDSYSSPITIPVIKSKRKGSPGHVARIEGRRCAGFRWGNLKTLGAGGRVILEILKKQDGKAWARLVWLGKKTIDELL